MKSSFTYNLCTTGALPWIGDSTRLKILMPTYVDKVHEASSIPIKFSTLVSAMPNAAKMAFDPGSMAIIECLRGIVV